MDHLDALERLVRLKESGALSSEEFDEQKRRLLSSQYQQSPSAPHSSTERHTSIDSEEETLDSFRGSTTRWLLYSFGGWFTLLMCLIGVGVVLILARWLSNIGRSFELTSQRLIVKTGILIKRVDEIELYRVKDIRVDFSLLNQWGDIGSITIKSSDSTSANQEFILRDVPHARERREMLRTLVDKARQRRGVREIDFDRVN